MKYLSILLLLVSVLSKPADAAIAYHPRAAQWYTSQAKEPTGASQWLQHVLPQKEVHVEGSRKNILSNRDGVISFSTGIAAVVVCALMAILIIDWSPFILAGALLAAVAAVVFGVRGRRRRPRGFAAAGMWLGIVTLGCAVTLGLGLLLLLAVL